MERHVHKDVIYVFNVETRLHFTKICVMYPFIIGH